MYIEGRGMEGRRDTERRRYMRGNFLFIPAESFRPHRGETGARPERRPTAR